MELSDINVAYNNKEVFKAIVFVRYKLVSMLISLIFANILDNERQKRCRAIKQIKRKNNLERSWTPYKLSHFDHFFIHFKSTAFTE